MSHLKMECDRSKVRCYKSNFGEEKDSHRRIILTHEFNHSVEVILPKSNMAAEVIKLMEGAKYFKGMEFPINFVQANYKGWTVLSEGTRIDCDDCVGITASDGKLIVSATETSHQTLGLDAQKSKYHSGIWRSVLSLEKDNGERLLKSLKRMPVFSIVGCCDDDEKVLSPQFESRAIDVDSVRLPDVSKPACERKNMKEEMEDLLEWMGGVLTGLLLNQNESQMRSFISEFRFSFEQDGKQQEKTPAHVVRFKGMISSQHCLKVLTGLRELMKKNECDWAVFLVRGFEDAPFSWGGREHGYGENVYAFYIFPDDDYYGFIIVGENDDLPI